MLITFLCITSESYAQKGTYKIDPTTKQVSGFNTKYTFRFVYTKDIKDEESARTSSNYNAIVIVINNEGTGTLIAHHDKVMDTYTIVSCHKYEDHYLFDALDKNNTPITAKLHLRNSSIEKFTIEGNDRISIFF
jgi:hypothetical protein